MDQLLIFIYLLPEISQMKNHVVKKKKTFNVF